MRAAFHGERNAACRGSGVMSVDMLTPPDNNKNHQQHYQHYSRNKILLLNRPMSPPYSDSSSDDDDSAMLITNPAPAVQQHQRLASDVTAWMEILDYTNGTSFRACIVMDEEGEKSLFVFFHDGVVARELKQALVAMIELAESPLECSTIILCIDRLIPQNEIHALMKNLQWVGFEPTMFDRWAKQGVDVTSNCWLLMGMDV